MRGIAGKQTRGLPTAARLHVADNTGAKVVQIVNILKLGGTMRRYPAGGVGDLAKVSAFWWLPLASKAKAPLLSWCWLPLRGALHTPVMLLLPLRAAVASVSPSGSWKRSEIDVLARAGRRLARKLWSNMPSVFAVLPTL